MLPFTQAETLDSAVEPHASQDWLSLEDIL
ncbi:rCG42127 [Rattus norvegicus]|uniref:RCG42127 n=1 Tax=Rattus norvegicus TaxID=10116 RepID=A6JUZ2_RAT|nr:rCG42127 [Rattus norvegicus]